jgi:thioredoxin 2
MASIAADILRCPNCGTRNRVPRTASGSPSCGRCHRPLPWLIEAGDSDFEAVTTSASVPVLVDVGAAWCGPCKVMDPHIEQLSRDMAGKLKVVKVDSEHAPSVAQRFQIRGVPTLMLLDRSRVLDRRTGALTGAALRRWIDDVLAHAAA